MLPESLCRKFSQASYAAGLGFSTAGYSRSCSPSITAAPFPTTNKSNNNDDDNNDNVKQVLGVAHVFVTHGHLDHCGAIVSHARLRALSQGPPAKYYMGAELAAGMEKVGSAKR